MVTNKPPSQRSSWQLALAIPLLAAVVTWVWVDATSSATACATGGGLHGPGPWGSIVLILVAPVIVAYRARLARPIASQIFAPAIASAALGVLLIYLATQEWWITNHCYL